jgi:hypothetical protein
LLRRPTWKGSAVTLGSFHRSRRLYPDPDSDGFYRQVLTRAGLVMRCRCSNSIEALSRSSSLRSCNRSTKAESDCSAPVFPATLHELHHGAAPP